ncbi:MAG: gamma-glutamyl-gamma-aminobutyrate hydrolase family protein [Desulfitobacterium sp.]|nr:gamma-glutamyl-gamma-aminobutyrate hydrolase family protein [Desulfitobacterium sp.]
MVSKLGRKPIIGITVAHCSEEINTYPRGYYVDAVKRAGGQPILLPPVSSSEEVREVMGLIQGLILTGGGDISPILLKETPLRGIGDCQPERDIGEILLAQEALAVDLPLLGICKGIQVLVVAAGGKIYQDIISQVPNSLEHKQKAPRNSPWHEVELLPSQLRELLGQKRIQVNSFHHQAVSEIPPDFLVSSKAPDGIIESIERRDAQFCVGVQWHPEVMVEDQYSQRIFRGLVEGARKKM